MSDILDLNADFDSRVVIDTAAMDWQASPSPTVWRKRLSASGPTEAGVVTTIVRYDADSSYATHPHPGGEEIFVLDGIFSDEHGDFPAGSFLLNPEGVSHAPFSKDGCVLFVKLRQYEGEGRERVAIDSNALEWKEYRPGAWMKPLYSQKGFPENVRLIRIDSGAGPFPHSHPGGEEVLVLDGELRDEHGVYPALTWTRSPAGSAHAPYSETGCVLLARTGFLRAPR